jgi:hypothetical protein
MDCLISVQYHDLYQLVAAMDKRLHNETEFSTHEVAVCVPFNLFCYEAKLPNLELKRLIHL